MSSSSAPTGREAGEGEQGGGRKGRGGRFVSQQAVKQRAVRAAQKAETDAAALAAGGASGCTACATKDRTIASLRQRLDTVEASLAAERERSKQLVEKRNDDRVYHAEQVADLETQLATTKREFELLKEAHRVMKSRRAKQPSAQPPISAANRARQIVTAGTAKTRAEPIKTGRQVDVPPCSDAAAFAKWKWREVTMRLMPYLKGRYKGGAEGNAVLQLLNCFFDAHPNVFHKLCIQRGAYTYAGQQIMAALRLHWDKELGSFLRTMCHMAWRKYDTLSRAVGMTWDPDKSEYVTIMLPFDVEMICLYGASTIAKFDKQKADEAGLKLSEDGQMACVDVRKALLSRLEQIPIEQIIAQLSRDGKIIIQFMGKIQMLQQCNQ